MAAQQIAESIEVVRGYYNRIDGVVLFLLLVLAGLLVVVWWLGEPSGFAFIVSSACALCGGLLGFLFAVPKRKRDAAAAPVAATAAAPAAEGSREATVERTSASADYESNTSLEEISDWLTKIIVGVGLVQAQEIAAGLGRAGNAVGTGIFAQPATGPAATVIGVATILAFAVLGFLAAFLWFRQNLMIAWAQSHREASTVPERRLRTAPTERVQAVTIPPPPGSMPAEPDIREFTVGAADSARTALEARVREKYAELRTRPKHPEDWAKGMFGGISARRNPGRALTASVKPVRGDERFQIVLTVTSDPPASGEAVFFLHNTFPDTTPVVALDKSGKATLTIYGWGAFTVGVLMDGGATELELDLSELPDAPTTFRNR
jgi:hypothetical protein